MGNLLPVTHLDDSPISDESTDETPIVAVLDYSESQAEEIAIALASSGADVYVTSNWAMCLAADGLIIPGHNLLEQIPAELKTVRAAEMIDARLMANKSVLAVGEAFSVFFETTLQGDFDNEVLQQWPGLSVESFTNATEQWLDLEFDSNSNLFRSLGGEKFFFENRFTVLDWVLDAQGPLTAPKVSWAVGENRFLAAVENGPLVATQFRPERSEQAGQQFLKNWVNSL